MISFLRADGSFFVSSVVSMYAVFLLFAALQAMDDAECNVLYSDSSGSLWIGYIISFLSISYAALRADRIGLLTYDQHKNDKAVAQSESVLQLGQQSQSDESDLVASDEERDTLKDDNNDSSSQSSDGDVVEQGGGGQEESKQEEVMEKQRLRKSHCFFHIVMTLAACYYAMLFTNWSHGEEIDTKGEAAAWINMGSQWACIFLFWWTLLAPLICPSRFETEEEDD